MVKKRRQKTLKKPEKLKNIIHGKWKCGQRKAKKFSEEICQETADERVSGRCVPRQTVFNNYDAIPSTFA